jgi:hypothetical protein
MTEGNFRAKRFVMRIEVYREMCPRITKVLTPSGEYPELENSVKVSESTGNNAAP